MQITQSAQSGLSRESDGYIPCLICVETPEFINHFHHIVSQADFTHVLVKHMSINELIEQLKAHQRQIGILVLEIPDNPDEHGIYDALDRLSHYIHRDTRIFGLSRTTSLTTRSRLIDIGFEDCFIGIPNENLLSIISLSSSSLAKHINDILIAITGLTGGVGASLIALNLARRIALSNSSRIIILNARNSHHSFQFLLGNKHQDQHYAFNIYHEIRISDRISIFEFSERKRFKIFGAEEFASVRSELFSHNSDPIIFIADCDLSSSILTISDHILLVAEPDYKNLNALDVLKADFNFSELRKKTNIILNKVEQNDRIEFGSQYFSLGDGANPIKLYRFAPKAVSAALASEFPVLPDAILSDRFAYYKLLAAFGLTIKTNANNRLVSNALQYFESLTTQIRNLFK